ncbi:MAG: hypothetical protein IKR11_08160 [Solobacterium sp.]|nr:hypothetical protein [Solobacterium sp.]
MSSEALSLMNSFSHVYVEKNILHHPRTERILSFFPKAEVIVIERYKDVFDRSRQNYDLQFLSQKLILAEKTGTFIYEGSKACEDFGNEWFYYCTNALNCIFNCEYCWLKGMYNSANPVIFVNLEDFFAETEKLLQQHPVYLCLSYETDLVPFENMTGMLQEWGEFTVNHPDLSIEIRTKSALEIWDRIPVNDRIIPSFTLSPDPVIERYEHKTPSLDRRLAAARQAVDQGFKVRLSFDPMFSVSNWQMIYAEMIEKTMQVLQPDNIRDINIGTFRLSKEYMRLMRKRFPDSAAVQYPYVLKDGFYQYPQEKKDRMEEYVSGVLGKYVEKEKIFRLEEK